MSGAPPPLVVLHGEEARSRLDEVARVYEAAFAAPPFSRTRADAERFRSRIIPAQLGYEGFTLVLAEGDGALHGFAYGYQGARGQHWTEWIRGILDARTAALWRLGDHFEVAEVAIEPAWQGRGLGRRIVGELLAHAPGDVPALLGTHRRAERARSLYESLGFVVIGARGDYLVLARPPRDEPGRTAQDA